MVLRVHWARGAVSLLGVFWIGVRWWLELEPSLRLPHAHVWCWCWLSAGTSSGLLAETPVCGISMWLLGSQPSSKCEYPRGIRQKLYDLNWPSLGSHLVASYLPRFRGENMGSPFDEECQRHTVRRACGTGDCAVLSWEIQSASLGTFL